MEAQAFDRLTRNLAKPSRRGLLRGLGALVFGGIATSGFGRPPSFKKVLAQAEDPDEPGILLMEEMARIAREHTGTCDELRSVYQEFREITKKEIAAIAAEEATWTKDHVRHTVIKYGDRRQAASDTIMPVMERCNSGSGGSSSGRLPVNGRGTSDLAAVLGIGMSATHGLAQSNAEGCTLQNYNFLVEGYCHKPGTDWSSPSFQWPAYCADGDIDGNCAMCREDFRGTETNPEICVKTWPNDCMDGEGNNLCVVDHHWSHGGIATSVCADRPADNVLTTTAHCFSNRSGWSSPEFTWEMFCPKGYGDSDCIDCGDYNGETAPGICEKYWPQDCHNDEYGNICYVGFHYSQVDADCHEACPLSNWECSENWFEGMTADGQACGGCQSAWCGSESHCMDRCVATGACDDECGSGGSSGGSWNPDEDGGDDDFPGGEGQTGGTPKPIDGTGTPTATATAPPSCEPTTPATTPTPGATGTPTATPADHCAPTTTPTGTVTGTPTATGTTTVTPTGTPTSTPTGTTTVTPTGTASPTPTPTGGTVTTTPTVSPTPDVSPTSPPPPPTIPNASPVT